MNTGQNPKGYNNPKDWESIENNNPKTQIINPDSDTFLDEPELVETEEVDFFESSNNTEENFDEVLQLTQYEGGLVRNESTDFVVAEYTKVDTVEINKATQKLASKFVTNVTKFILEFNDVQLTDAHKDYIKQVGKLQLSDLQNMLSMIHYNKCIIDNIIARVNATQAEDYAIITSYNNLVNQQIKLIKETSVLYRSIPSVMKKMRADILTNQEIENNGNNNDEVMTEEYGESQFNNSKQLLKSILAKKQQPTPEN
jgi:hypothetical protein